MIIPKGIDWARHIIEYRDNGLPTSESFYDMNNNRTMNNGFGYAKIIIKYDKWNNRCEADFYNSKAELFISPVYGCACIKYIYDDKNLLRESYYDTKGSLIISTLAYYAELVKKYDRKGNLLETAIFDEKGKPMANLYQYSSTRYQYNENGLVISQEYYDTDGKPIVAKNCGYAKIVNEYGKNNTITKTIYYDDNGNTMKFEDIIKQTLIYIPEVVSQSTAQKAGIKVNDILLKYNDWSCFPIENIDTTKYKLAKELAESKNSSKTIVVYRPSDASVHTFVLRKD